jgi:hypothetical protein
MNTNPSNTVLAKTVARTVARLQEKATNIMARQLSGGSTVISWEVPGRVPGSKAVYFKIVNRQGETTLFFKTTYGPDGKEIHTKVKFSEPDLDKWDD